MMQNQSQNANLNYDHSQYEKWVDTVSDPTQLAQIASKVIGKISTLPSGQRDQVISNLRSDVRFTEFADKFTPQTA